MAINVRSTALPLDTAIDSPTYSTPYEAICSAQPIPTVTGVGIFETAQPSPYMPQPTALVVPRVDASTAILVRTLIPSTPKSFKSPKEEAIMKETLSWPLAISSFNFRITLSTASGADFLAFAKGEFRFPKNLAPCRAIKRSFSIVLATPPTILFQIRFFIIFLRLFDRQKLGRVGSDDLIFRVRSEYFYRD